MASSRAGKGADPGPNDERGLRLPEGVGIPVPPKGGVAMRDGVES